MNPRGSSLRRSRRRRWMTELTANDATSFFYSSLGGMQPLGGPLFPPLTTVF